MLNKAGERLEYFIRHKGYKLNEFAEIHGINYHTLIPVTSGTRSLGMKLVMSVTTAYPELNANWLLHGRGVMEINNEAATGLDDFSLQLAKHLKKDEATRNAVLKYLSED
ncbi:hypothetical protein [uncultured Flavobacterium sp.]|uniref:hypothetical protein n=1 Tax=uncultured Flavobacterium sp. TaxID=165435 RepID=UPI0025E06C63|nr:hypothetical protein [uncultured Flavobacterium sp.]